MSEEFPSEFPFDPVLDDPSVPQDVRSMARFVEAMNATAAREKKE